MEQSAPPAHENAAKGRKNEESCTGEGKEGPFESKEPTYSAGTEGQSTGGAGAGGGVKTGDLAPCAAATVTAATTSKGIVVNEDQSSGEDIRIVGGDGVVVVATSGDGVTGGVEVVMVEVSKKVPDLVEMATERLAQHEAVCLRSLEKVWRLLYSCQVARPKQTQRRVLHVQEKWQHRLLFLFVCSLLQYLSACY